MQQEPQIIIITWHDAGSGQTVAEASSHHRVSVGYLVEDTPDGIALSMESDGLSSIHYIPRAYITGPVVYLEV